MNWESTKAYVGAALIIGFLLILISSKVTSAKISGSQIEFGIGFILGSIPFIPLYLRYNPRIQNQLYRILKIGLKVSLVLILIQYISIVLLSLFFLRLTLELALGIIAGFIANMGIYSLRLTRS